jgi:hypothetical protein
VAAAPPALCDPSIGRFPVKATTPLRGGVPLPAVAAAWTRPLPPDALAGHESVGAGRTTPEAWTRHPYSLGIPCMCAEKRHPMSRGWRSEGGNLCSSHIAPESFMKCGDSQEILWRSSSLSLPLK